MADDTRSKQVENEVKTQIATGVQEIITSIQSMMKTREARTNELRKETVRNRSIDVGKQ